LHPHGHFDVLRFMADIPYEMVGNPLTTTAQHLLHHGPDYPSLMRPALSDRVDLYLPVRVERIVLQSPSSASSVTRR
jgi:hypothetical protein